MEIVKRIESIGLGKIELLVKALMYLLIIMSLVLVLMALMGCSKSNSEQVENQGSGEVSGSVKDEDGNPYPSTLISLSKGNEKTIRATNELGVYNIKTKDIGTYTMEILLPLSTKLVSSPISTVNVQANQTSTVDIVISPQDMIAHINLGAVDVLNEVKDINGNTPTDDDTPLYAANYFQEPIGFLSEIKAPDDHHITLSEWKKANGSILVHCNGKSSTVEITLEGLIPNGTYAFFLGFLNKSKKVGEHVELEDLVYPANPPIGASDGSENVLIAGSDGTLTATLEHTSCILTEEVALVIPVVYHINGWPSGGGFIPDVENVAHLLIYFQ